MASFELVQFDNDLALAKSAAAQLLAAISASPANGRFSLALSGGRIAQRFFSALVEQARELTADLSAVRFFWADERCVPPTDPESNFGIAHKLLFGPLKIPPSQIHRIQGELAPTTAASLASEALLRGVEEREQGQPVLDLVLLGMGEDGHVASLFPEEPKAAMLDAAVYRPVISSKPPPQRVTIGYLTLGVARRVWVLASGPGKESALKAALAGADIPLGRVLASRKATRILTDVRLV